MSVVKAAIHVCIIIVASLLVFTMAEDGLPVYHTQVEVAGSNCNVGYRQMWRILQAKYQFVTKGIINSMGILYLALSYNALQ